MRASVLVTTVTVALLLAGCTSDDGDDPEPEVATCPVSIDRPEIERQELAWLDRRGPNIDRDLSVTRAPNGDLCVEIVTDHADPGAAAVSYRIVAKDGDQEWRIEGEDPSGQLPLRVDATGCVTVTGEVKVLGEDGQPYPYRARLRARCD